MNTDPFYRFRAEATGEPTSAELLIFSVIGDWEDMGEQSAIGFAKDLAKLPSSVKRLDIHINSPGGSVSEAMGIYSRLADHRSDKHVYIDGLAASAASLIAMVGHKIFIRANANVMIHLPMAIGIGNADDFRTIIAALDSHTESMLNVYGRRTKQERNQLRDWMAAETWMHAEEAVERGFADEVRGVVKAAAMVGSHRAIFNGTAFDLSRFHNIPAFTGTTESNTMPKLQKPKAQTQPAGDEPSPAPEPQPQPQPEPEPAPAQDPPPQPEHHETTPSDPPPAPAAAKTEFDKGVQAERARIAALQKLDRPATHAVITKAIAEGKSVSDITVELFDAMEKAGNQTARRADASSLDTIPPSDGAGTRDDNFGAKIKSSVKARLKNRGGMRSYSRN